MTAKIFFFDFDGVICDSINECLFSALNAYYQIFDPEKKVADFKELNNKVKAEFTALRPFVRSGEDYLILIWMIENNITAVNQKEFDLVRLRQKNQLRNYKRALQKERNCLLKNKRKQWLDLNPLFDFNTGDSDLWSSQYLQDKYILTTKKKNLVLEILKHHRIDFPNQQIVCTDSNDKIEVLQSVLKEVGTVPEEAVLLEDQISYLIKAKEIGAKVFLAGWGYITEMQKIQAKELGISILGKDEFRNLIVQK